MIAERSGWKVKDEAIHEELVQLMALTPEEIRTLSLLAGDAVAGAPEMMKDFYARLLAHDNTREFFEGVEMDKMRASTAQWFIELFSGKYGQDYVRRRLQIGHIHSRIGLPVRYPLAMIDVVLEHGVRVALKSDRPAVAARAIRKVVALDIAIFTQAYEDARPGGPVG